MSFYDITFVLKWWLVLFVIGIIFLPLTTVIFKNFFDRGYIFAKILGIALINYVVFVLGILRILPFTELTIFLIVSGFLIVNILISKSFFKTVIPSLTGNLDSRFRGNDTGGSMWKIFLFEEIIFLATLFFWSYIRAHQPEIHGLEKYMDFGFVNSIIRSEHFPPKDMWFTPLPINYYYFGHLVTAVLTKISTIPSSITYNLMLSTIFALTFTGAFSIGANLLFNLKSQNSKLKIMVRQAHHPERSRGTAQNLKLLLGGLLSAFLVSLAGNLHAIYAFFKPYANENPVPFWQLAFSFNTFPNNYWYPNATRFIHNTIHEFPIYSFVVSDLHGHFLDIPFVLLTIAVLLSLIFNFQFSIFNQIKNLKNSNSFQISNFKFQILLLAFLLAVMYMTNAWDGAIYFLLTALVLFYIQCRRIQTDRTVNTTNNPILQILPINKKMQKFKQFLLRNWVIDLFICLFVYLFIIVIGLFLFSLPFNLFFKPFASGIGILCSPEFLTNIGKLGPFLFEKDHCLRSPLWQLLILYGFFYFWAVSFIVYLFKNSKFEARNSKQYQITKIQNSKPSSTGSRRFEHSDFDQASPENLSFDYAQDGELAEPFRISKFGLRISTPDVFILILILVSTFLIIIPEFIYVKDIYPGHYRANTMFKLVYQAFIMLSIASGYIIVRLMPSILRSLKNKIPNIFNFYFVFFIFSFLFFILVMIYPYFAINSYYGDLKTYHGLDGTLYLKKLYPTDYEGILWINKNIKGQPVILEAQGDSYTDYGRVSTNTGLPTVLGWTVHEWLWRGTYNIPSPRIPEVQSLYEAESIEDTKKLIDKYKIELVFIGNLEKEKYPKLNEDKFKRFGKVIYENGNTRIYKVD